MSDQDINEERKFIHDLMGPLTVIQFKIGAIEKMAKNNAYFGQEALQRDLDTLQNNYEKLKALVQDRREIIKKALEN